MEKEIINAAGMIEEILRKGNDVIIRKKGENIQILEDRKKVVYSPLLDRK